jgi:hypothetical protein
MEALIFVKHCPRLLEHAAKFKYCRITSGLLSNRIGTTFQGRASNTSFAG